VAHRLHQVDELSLVRCQLDKAGDERVAEDGDGAGALVKNNAEPDT
jgi:hypothetical protein